MYNAYRFAYQDGNVTLSHDGFSGLDEYACVRAAQLEALIALMAGTRIADFEAHSTDVKESLLWLAESLAEEVSDLMQAITRSARTPLQERGDG